MKHGRLTKAFKQLSTISLLASLSISLASFSHSSHANEDIVGNLSGEFTVNAGNLSYTLPIVTPEGIHGLQPNIAISYSNSVGAGLLGAGFTLSASSSISRCNPSVSVDGFKAGIEDNNNARFCLDGAKLIAVSGDNGGDNTEYRNVEDNNTRYFSRGGNNNTPAYWEVHSPEGFKYTYERVSTIHNAFSAWFLTEKRDFFGNAIHYAYSADLMPELEQINYSGYTIDFEYEHREQPIGHYRDGHYYELSKRLNAIALSRSGTEINRYKFIYETIIPDDGQLPLEPLEKLKRLAQVEKCYGPNGQGGCLKPLSFNYQEQPNAALGLDHPDDRTIVVPRSYYADSDQVEGTQLYQRPSYAAADMNHDGLSDFCYYRIGTGIMCAVSDGNGGYGAPTAWTGNLGYSPTEEQYSFYSRLQLIDLNADTYTDFCLIDDTGVRCGINNQSNSFTNVGYWNTALTYDDGTAFSFVNDDIYPDVCGLSASNRYQCFSGNGSQFSGSLLSLTDVVDNIAEVSWAQAGVCRQNEHTNEYDCADPVEWSDKITMPSAQWIDIDGDIDNDLCWLSADSSAMKCSYRSTDPTDQSIQMSAPQSIYSFNYSLLSSLNISSEEVDGGQSQDYQNNIESVKTNTRRFISTLRTTDVNGDLLPDICYANGHQYLCSLNQGNSFAPATTWINVAHLFPDASNDEDLSSLVTIRLDDMNLDGLADFCIIKNEQQQCGYNQIGSFGDLIVRQSIAADKDTNTDAQEVYENFVRKITHQISNAVGGLFGGWKTVYVTGTSNLAYGNIVNVPDINGDGYPEFCYRSIHGILCTTNDNYGPSALLTGITDSFGQQTTIEYGSLLSDNLYDGATEIPSGYYEQRSNALVVDTITVTSGVVASDWPYNTPITNSQSYRYKGYVRNPITGVGGYSAMTVTQNERDVSTTMHFSVAEHLVGRQTFIEEYIGNALLKTKRNDYSIVDLPDGRHRVRLDQVEEKQFDLDGTLVSTSTSNSANFDGYGYPQQAVATKVMAEDGETLVTTTTTEYHHDTQHWILARPDLQTVDHQYQGQTATRVVDYHFANGLMTGETLQPSASNASTIQYAYDNVGNTTTVTTSGQGQSRTVSKTFDDMGRVLSLTNALGQSEQFAYHATCPGVVSHTDVAGKITTTSYDAACRQLTVDAPDSNATTWAYEWATADDNSLVNQPIDHPYDYRNPIVYTVKETRADGTWAKTWFDAQGRDIRNSSIGFSSENYQRAIVSDTVYDRFGRKTATTLPYYHVNGEGVTPSWMTVSHDSASRIIAEHKMGPDGQPMTVDYSYDKNSSTISYSDYSKTTQNGVHGKTLLVNENGLTVSYTYDPLGNLVSTNQEGVVTQVSYDSRGFKSQQIDPAMGTWTYQYNAFGELTSQTDAKNQTTTFVYDELGRLIERNEPEGQTQWVYNTAGNGIGQVHQELGIHATKQWAYDSLGRAVSETLDVDGQQFVTQFEYDEFSRPIKTINPNGLEVHNGFDSTGAVNEVSIPANQIRGFDAQLLLDEYEAVLLLFLEVENQIESLEQRRDFHLAQSLEYQQQALHYAGLLDEVQEEVALLTELAQDHEDLAARYQQAIDDLTAQANAYRAEFGDRIFTFTGIENNQYKFVTSWCADRHRVWGGCKRREVRHVSISASNLNTADINQPIYPSFEMPGYCNATARQVPDREGGSDLTVYDEECFPARRVTVPTCDSYRSVGLVGREGDYVGLVNQTHCTSVRPHEIYSRAAADFAKLRDAAMSKAEYYRDQIEKESTSQLSPLVLVSAPTGNYINVWIPIGIDIVTMINATVPEMHHEWRRMSLDDTIVHYQEKVDYYTAKAIDELDAYNSTSRELEELTAYFGELDNAQHHFSELLLSAGLLIGDDLGVEGLLQQTIERQEQWANDNQPLMVWSATMRAANGLVENELFGNGLYTNRTVDHDTGLITSIKTGAYSAATPLRQLDYTFDERGMIIARSDTSNTANSTDEQYEYDLQGRLRSWSFDQHINDEASLTSRHNQLWRTYDYDNRGNMTYKTGAGDMYYNSANQLVARDIQADLTVNYSYDANGNMLQGDGRSYQWNSFNKVDMATNSGYTVNFSYDAGHRRVVKKSEQETIYYVSPGYEKVIKHYSDRADEVIHRHNIWNGDDVVATFEKREVDIEEMYLGDDVKYYHRDHLGNGELVTGADMQVIAQRFYTPYGELVEDVLQREQSTTSRAVLSLGIETDDYMRDLIDSNDSLNSDIHLLAEALAGGDVYSDDYRGFTSHETIKELGLVNMNARLYDPVIGRFISADSVIPDISDPLAYNRYIYVKNNPVMYRDPTGHWWQIAAAVFFYTAHLTDYQALQQLSTAILAAALAFPGSETVAAGPLSAAAFSGGGTAGTMAASMSAFTTTLTVSFLRSGDPKASARAAVFSAVAAGASEYIGHQMGFTADQWFEKAALHGVAQGAISDLRGDGFAAGFVSGLTSSVTGHFSEKGNLDDAARAGLAMVSGFISAEAVGGDGFQGALNAAIVFLYNDLAQGKTVIDLDESQRIALTDAIDEEIDVIKELFEIDADSNGLLGEAAYNAGYKGFKNLDDGTAFIKLLQFRRHLVKVRFELLDASIKDGAAIVSQFVADSINFKKGKFSPVQGAISVGVSEVKKRIQAHYVNVDVVCSASSSRCNINVD